MSCPELLPIMCDLNDDEELSSSDSEEPLLALPLHDIQLDDDDSLHDEEEGISDPMSPTMKRLNPVRTLPTRSTPTASTAPRVLSTTILEESLLFNATPNRSNKSSLPPLFDAQPLFNKRPIPVIPTPSRIPRSMERSTPSTSAPGIRMPGQFHLTYDRPSNFAELSDAIASSGISSENSMPMRLDARLDITPKCPVYLSSPYPRLTKQANHTVKYYEKRVAEMKRDSQPSIPTPRQVARSRIMNTTPKKADTHSTAPKTVEGGKRTLNRTIPISPKLATASRSRKCQCCEGGVHSHTHRRTKGQPATTVGKRAATLRRRPDVSATPTRHAAPPATASKTMRTVRYAPSTVKKVVPKEAPKPTPSATAATPAKPKLNLTTSLPEFKQPLANIAPTPQKSRQEIDDKLRTPLPQPTPRTPSTSAAAVNSRIAALEATQTPSKFKTLDEILGPNYQLVHDFNVLNPYSDTPLEQSLLD